MTSTSCMDRGTAVPLVLDEPLELVADGYFALTAGFARSGLGSGGRGPSFRRAR
jgi:hypothetical protein